MTLLPTLQPTAALPLFTTNTAHYTEGANASKTATRGSALDAIPHEEGGFGDLLLRTLDGVSAQNNEAAALAELAIVDPGAVDAHDVSIAEAKASLALNLAATVINRLVQDWKEITTMR